MRTRTVYFASDPNLDRIKIGKTIDLNKRFVELCRMSPNALLLVAEVDGYTEVEGWFHLKFQDKRLHGEWFFVDEELASLVRYIQEKGRSASRYLCPLAVTTDLTVRTKIVAESFALSSGKAHNLRRLVTFEQRQEICGRHEHGESLASIALRLSIPKPIVVGIALDIATGFTSGSKPPLKYLTGRRRRFLGRS